ETPRADRPRCRRPGARRAARRRHLRAQPAHGRLHPHRRGLERPRRSRDGARRVVSAARIADPYRDLAVIDSRAPRFNQAVIGLLALLAVATGWWWLLAALAANLALRLTFGRRVFGTCVADLAPLPPLVGQEAP